MPPSFVRLSCILDTDIVIDFLRRQPYARALLHEMAELGVAGMSTVTQLEVFQGMRPGEEEATRTFLDGLISMPVTTQIARAAGRMRAQLLERGIVLPVADAIIGATAVHFDVPLVANDGDHYPFPGLRLRRGR